MVRLLALALTLLLPSSIGHAAAQTPLSVAEVIAMAKARGPSAKAAAAAEDEASARLTQARAMRLPHAEVTQSWQRGNQPVFVFGSKLMQRRFTAEDFSLQSLNQPDALANVRTSIMVSQPLFDAGASRAAIRTADLQRGLSALARQRTEQDLAVAALQTFGRVLQWDSTHRATNSALLAAESDGEQAKARRDAGLATDADVLAVEVHAADLRQRLESAEAERQIAREELNAAIGREISMAVELTMPPLPTIDGAIGDLESVALRDRPETRQADAMVLLADTDITRARTAFLPRVEAMGGWEVNGTTVRGASSWIGGVELRLNLFNGFSDRARLSEATASKRRQDAEREAQATAVRLEVRAARARLEAARARMTAGAAAVDLARETQRIVRDRYEQGLATITDVLRAAEALLRAESLVIDAQVSAWLQGVALDRALGRL